MRYTKVRRVQYDTYLDMHTKDRHFNMCRTLTDTIYWTNYSFSIIPVLVIILKCKFMCLALYMLFLFSVLIHFCIYAEEVIEKANKINFIDEGEYQ